MITTHDARRSLFLFALLATPSAAQVNPSGSWRTLHTQHFRIHFRPDYRARALAAAAEAERAYALLATELHPPRGIVDLTLSDDVDAPNGFANTYPSNRLTILLVPPVADPGLQTYDSWERLVIVHELTHVFHLDRSRGLWKTLQSVLGRAPGLFPNHYQPSWVSEGLATYYESRFTAGGRADGSFHRQVVGADAVNGQARSPWDALLFTRWPDGYAPYAYGSRFWEYLGRTAGDSLVPRFVEAAAGQLIPFRVGRQLRRAGAPRALTDTWNRAIAAATPAQRITDSRVIVGAQRSQPVPRVSPDGRSVAYAHDDGRGARQLRVSDAASGAVVRSHRVNGQVSYDWLGDTLVVAQLEFADRWRVRSDLWRWLPNGDWQRVTTGARLIEPRAGGAVLAALRLGSGDNAPAIAPRSLPQPRMADQPGTTWGAVVPSPDGRSIVATRHQNGRWALVRWPVAHPDSVVALTAPSGVVADPVWVPSGILYVTDVAGFPQVHRWTERGVEQVTAEPLGARTPAPLPDGRIFFTTLGAQGWELRVVQPGATRPAAMTPPAPARFDSAPPVRVRETGYSVWPSLRPHFWLPLGINAGEAGRFFGALTSGTDAIGRYSYAAWGLVSVAPARAQGAFVLVSHALGDPALDVSASNDWSLVGVGSGGHVVSVEDREAALGATVVARRWRSAVSLRVAAEYEGKRYTVSPDTVLSDMCFGCDRRDLVGGVASISVGSAVNAPLAVSLQDGAAVTALYRHQEEQGTSRWLNDVRARGALYARVGPRIGFAHPVVALRFAVGALDGPLPERFSVGGVSSGGAAFALGQTIGTLRTFPVRGYSSGTLRGRRAATAAAEVRVPLALIGKSLGHLPLGADKLAFAIFGDIGDAWDPGDAAQLHRLRSVGIELIGDLTVSYDLPLRFRLGVARPATGDTRVYGAFASDF